MRALAVALSLLVWPTLAHATQFPCTEQGILDAIAAGGGPHTFACVGPTTVVTSAEIVIDNDVILDGQGNLTVDANNSHRVFSVLSSQVVELKRMAVTGGYAWASGPDSSGGGLRVTGTLSLDGVTVMNNQGWWGGGIAVLDGGLTAVRSTISRNNATNLGGGIAVEGYEAAAEVLVLDSTIASNAAAIMVYPGIVLGTGGGIGASGDFTIEVVNTTISSNGSGNQSVSGGGFGTDLAWGTVTLRNSTVAENFPNAIGTDGEAPYPITVHNSVIEGFCGIVVGSGGGNIESPTNSCGLDDPTDQVSVSSKGVGGLNLGPLQDNGGPTDTHALLLGSVAIDAAVDCPPPVFDQRGVERPAGAFCDSGSFEYVPEPSLAVLQASALLTLVVLGRLIGTRDAARSR